jgi:hypothetical protein
MVVPPPPAEALRRARPRRRRRSPLPFVLAALAAAAIAAAIVGIVLLRDDSTPGGKAAGTQTIPLAAAGSYDPEGDDKVEHPERVGDAVDHDLATYWTTQTYYSSFQKNGVGPVFTSGRAADIRRVVVRSDTPGFEAEIQTGSSPGGPFHSISGSQSVQDTTTFQLDGAAQTYLLIWITSIPAGVVHVNEVSATS